MSQTLLALFAHPDDETFGSGGTLAHYAGREVVTALVCATNGDAGEIANGGYGHPDHLAIHRHTVAAFHAAGGARDRAYSRRSYA